MPLINKDFFGVSGFTKNLSNKGKLLYFLFLVNADGKGFVGNGLDIAENLDKCEEIYENVLFQTKYVDALDELVEKRLTFEFKDKLGNKTYLIKHWFMHNKNQKYLTTNYVSYLAQVELINGEYHIKNNKEGKPLKEKEIKEIKLNEINEIKSNNITKENKIREIKEKMENLPLEENKINDPFYSIFEGDNNEKKDY